MPRKLFLYQRGGVAVRPDNFFPCCGQRVVHVAYMRRYKLVTKEAQSRINPGRFGANHKLMSDKTVETRVAELEQSLADAHETIKGMFVLVNVMADFQKTATVKTYDWMIALETRNNQALEILSESLTDDEARQKLKGVLARNVFDRDQLEAMIKKIKAFPANPLANPAPPGA